MNCVNDRELDEYIDRVIGTMSEDQLSELEQSPYPYVVKIQGKVKELIAQHRSGVFDTWLEQDKISCLPNYALPAVISPTAFTSMVPKSLYTAEEDMNEYELRWCGHCQNWVTSSGGTAISPDWASRLTAPFMLTLISS